MQAKDFEELKRRVDSLEERIEDLAKPLPWKDWMDDFLGDLERLGSASAAIDLCPYSRPTVYDHKRRNSEFDKRWRAIKKRAREDRRPRAKSHGPKNGAQSNYANLGTADHARSRDPVG